VTLVIGTDEAGYGPNLGPLTVAATLWRVNAAAEAAEERLTANLAAAAPDRLWDDSKAIYRGGTGFEPLERGVLTAIGLTGAPLPEAWPSLATTLGAQLASRPPEHELLVGLKVPRHTSAAGCATAAGRIRARLAAGGVQLVAVRGRMVPPAEFNALLDRGLNKSDILSLVTLDLAAALAGEATALDAAAAEEPVLIWCDRHGGRRRYAPLVSRAFAAPLVSVLEETPPRSRYAFGPAHRIEFSVGGESRPPIAVASMAAKYLRELAMLAFNRFWGERQAGLRGTAGYPVDAGRWRKDAAPGVERAGVGWDAVWRRA
jgi:hypothetical protein